MSEDKNKNLTKLEQLLQWKMRPFLDKMLDDGESPNRCATWIRENGMEISTPTVYTYAKRRKEAIVKGIQMESVMDKRDGSANLINQKKKKKEPKKSSQGVKVDTSRYYEPPAPDKPVGQSKTNKDRKREYQTVNKLQTDLELLDAVMQKGYETLSRMEAIAPRDFLRAIELKHKITGGSHGGLTTYGIEEIRLREVARENAMLVILLKYVPEDKHEEVLAEMEKATLEYYESIGLGNAYENATINAADDAVNK